jgi:predicted dehydrogenase
MSRPEGISRRAFVSTVGGATVGAALAGSTTLGAQARRRYAIIGTGNRGIGMWARPIAQEYRDVIEFVGLCDINPLRVEVAKRQIGVSCPTFTDFDRMMDQAKPDLLMVTTVDGTHSEYIVKALNHGIDVMTEKPMVIDEQQCQAVLDAERRSGRNIIVTFNYRYAPKHRIVKETLMSGKIGKITSVDFSWYLDTRHGADYFRRWHRLRSRSGSLWVHKATHHFDLMNWWLDADPVHVSAFGSLQNYGKSGPFRHTTCRGCPHQAKCPYYWDITRDQSMVALYVNCESADGYTRDGCVFKADIDIFDTMNAIVRYSNGVSMSYSVSTFMPIEGYRVAFNGTLGRLEVRDYERQAWQPAEATEIELIHNFGKKETIAVTGSTAGGHGGGDTQLRDLIFRQADAPAHMRLPNSRAGAMSCLTGIAARKSIDENRPIRIADLVKLS